MLSLNGRSSATFAPRSPHRVKASGKFLHLGDEKLLVRGVTYGTFRPGSDGTDYPTHQKVAGDFRAMADSGVNAVRVYTVPPAWLLDTAESHGLRVLIGLPWEQHVAFLDERGRAASIEHRVRDGVSACAGHPAVLGYAVGNEIPATIVRWSGRRRVEAFLQRLCGAVREEDPTGLVTYANYPTTEYLDLPFLDFLTFNVYLEDFGQLGSYLSRLQNLAADRPLVIGEIGLDSRGHGELAQARSVEHQIRTCFAAGSAGTFVFSWTDEWHRGGHEVTDWDFGLTSRDRTPKPALGAARRAWADAPFATTAPTPRMSVVVCVYNAEETIHDCLDGISKLRYPNFETIVIDDGSTDATARIAGEYDVRLIRTENRGLSAARNRGLEEATGQIVAYIDGDAWPDPDWLTYLADTFAKGGFVGVGGPNLPPPGDGPIAACVANAPGGPVHILVSDQEAEHIPGCNMAFWRSALADIGGFDRRFRVAGDDVDVCWRLQTRGWRIAFNPAALVWHHHRDSVGAYWAQQRGYGRAEALLEAKWPQRYNATGHVTWGGRVYGRGLPGVLRWTQRVYHGTWGSAPFQPAHDAPGGILWELVRAPEWYLVLVVLAVLSGLGALWSPLLWTTPLFVLAAGALVGQAALGARRARHLPLGATRRLRHRALTVVLHLLQPLARLAGRLSHGLSPWRFRHAGAFLLPFARGVEVWSEKWESPGARLRAIEERLKAEGIVAHRGGAYDRWDLEVRGGIAGAGRLQACVEEHGDGRQLTRYALRPAPKLVPTSLLGAIMLLAVAAVSDGAAVAGFTLAAAAITLGWRVVAESGAALYAARGAIPAPVTKRSAGNDTSEPSRAPVRPGSMSGNRSPDALLERRTAVEATR